MLAVLNVTKTYSTTYGWIGKNTKKKKNTNMPHPICPTKRLHFNLAMWKKVCE